MSRRPRSGCRTRGSRPPRLTIASGLRWEYSPPPLSSDQTFFLDFTSNSVFPGRRPLWKRATRQFRAARRGGLAGDGRRPHRPAGRRRAVLRFQHEHRHRCSERRPAEHLEPDQLDSFARVLAAQLRLRAGSAAAARLAMERARSSGPWDPQRGHAGVRRIVRDALDSPGGGRRAARSPRSWR